MSERSLGNINRSVPIDLTTQDYTNEYGFFIRSNGSGVIKYCPVGNTDVEAITKTVDAQVYFIDPELCRKVFKVGTTATGLHAGYGI